MKIELLIMTTFVAMALPLKAIAYIVGPTGKTELVGTDGSAVPGGGTNANFPSGTVVPGTTFAKFQMLNDATKQRAFDMKVTVQNVVGTLDTSSGTKNGLMIAQTTNSQGLTDTGTLTILSDFASTSLTSVTFAFEFFEPDSQTPTSVAMQLTSFDFDFGQFIQVSSSDFSQAAFGSRLTASEPVSGQLRYAAPSDSFNASFSDAPSAVSLTSVSDTGFSLTLGKLTGGGNSLFMLEFRDPSINLTSQLPQSSAVPEPSTALLCSIMGFAFLRRKRRA